MKLMSKIICFGDLHGRTNWKDRIDLSYEKIIFLGDYVDSFDINDKQIINNLKDLIQLKKDNIDKVELLLGNHDLMYYFLSSNGLWRCSGFRQSYAHEIHRLFNENKQLFKASYQITKGHIDGKTVRWFFSHAGLSRLFLKQLQNKISKEIIDIENTDYSTYINEIFNSIPNYLSDVSFYRGGSSTWGGPFWADLREFSKNSYIPGLNQICGHQPVKEITVKEFDKNTKMIWIDTESHQMSNEKAIYELEI